jgi:3',5'-cyclic AMP phosphodiesterase CpdA
MSHTPHDPYAAAQVPGTGRISAPRLLAVSDLHIGMADNRPITESLRPAHEDDWLIVAGDVGELTDDITWALRLLAGRFAKVIWTPGNHELWTPREDPVQLRGEARYRYLVRLCRDLGVSTPEDPWPVWRGPGGPVAVAPLFLLYDYTFRVPGTTTKEESLARAHEAGVVCTDEYLLHPDPHPTRDAWCRARVAATRKRLLAHDPAVPLVLVNHFPLVREPTDVLWHPEFAQWCGTVLTADWHRRFTTAAVVYGHLHIPRTTWYDGVRFEEVSIGYPREWRRRGHPRGLLRQILPEPGREEARATTGAESATGTGARQAEEAEA